MLTVGKVHVPCGCEARKDVMFARGELGKRELAIVLASVTLLAAAFLTRTGGGE